MKSGSMDVKDNKKRMNLVIYIVLTAVLAAVAYFIAYAGTKVFYGNRIAEMEEDFKSITSELEEKNTLYETLLKEHNTLVEHNAQMKKVIAVKDEEIEKLKSMTGDLSSETIDLTMEYAPGRVLSKEEVPEDYGIMFKAYEITEGDSVYERINGKSYRKNNNIGLDDLRYLKLIHYNFNHEVQVGEMIVNAEICEDVLNIFRELYEEEYEIYSIYLVDNYWTGDPDTSDSNSIEYNNTSSFNYRYTTGGGSLSNHAYGRAIDINPQQNPYISKKNGEWRWTHENADEFVFNRSDNENPHVIVKGDVCYNIFRKYGFSWGGNWSNPIDYQHFEKEE